MQIAVANLKIGLRLCRKIVTENCGTLREKSKLLIILSFIVKAIILILIDIHTMYD